MKRKMLLVLSLVLSILLVAVGCATSSSSNGGSGKSQASPGGESNNKVTLTLWYWNKSIDDKLLEQVNTQFPNVDLKTQKIDGATFETKLQTTLAAGSGGPDIVALNSWIADFFPNEDKFANLLDYGAADIQNLYLDWKWKKGVTPSGKLIAVPMDIGPTGLFYRQDLFQQAGLPSDPKEVTAKLKTWDDYIEAGVQLKSKTGLFMFDNINTVFSQVLGQSDKVYFDQSNKFIGDQAHVKQAWAYAVKVHQLDLSNKVKRPAPEWNAALNNGKVASFVGAVWSRNILSDAAPDTSGKWRVARSPGGDGNNGGSYVGVLKQSKHPKEAFEVIKWLQSPKSQLQGYTSLNLFPSTPSVLNDPVLLQPEPFYGGQKTVEIFGEAAKNVKPSYFGPQYTTVDSILQQELVNIDTQNKDPNKAWNDAMTEIKSKLSQ